MVHLPGIAFQYPTTGKKLPANSGVRFAPLSEIPESRCGIALFHDTANMPMLVNQQAHFSLAEDCGARRETLGFLPRRPLKQDLRPWA